MTLKLVEEVEADYEKLKAHVLKIAEPEDQLMMTTVLGLLKDFHLAMSAISKKLTE